MSTVPAPKIIPPRTSRLAPFRRAVISGMGVVLPPLLTVVILLWVWGTLDQYVLTYVKSGTRAAILYYITDIRVSEDPPPHPIRRVFDDREFHRVGTNHYVPSDVYLRVLDRLAGDEMPSSARRVYELYVDYEYLKPQVVIPVFLCVFILLMYFLGKFMAAGAGRFFFALFERGVLRLPMVRRVYASVKQVTDFMIAGPEIEFTRVVAVEYPRRGMWSIGFVMGEGLLDVAKIAKEPVLSVLLPTSPMPVTGYACMFRRSDVIDLTLSVEDALQYIISCGVVVAQGQWVTPEIKAEMAARAAATWALEEPSPAKK